MTNREILNIAMAQSAVDLCAEPADFEKNENDLIRMVFDGQKMCFPSDNLNLNGMMITYDKY